MLTFQFSRSPFVLALHLLSSTLFVCVWLMGKLCLTPIGSLVLNMISQHFETQELMEAHELLLADLGFIGEKDYCLVKNKAHKGIPLTYSALE